MRSNSDDKTLERNYLQKWRFLIREYELVKEKKHPQFRFVTDFFKFHSTTKQTFHKYYNRFCLQGSDLSLLPRKRGPKWQSRRPLNFIEQQVLKERRRGNNRYEIVAILKPRLKSYTPSPSGVYNICKRHGLNRLKPKMKESKRQIIKTKAGELGHMDCHYLSKNLILSESKRHFLFCIVDSCTRLAWVEVINDVKSLTVMFAVMRSMNVLSAQYGIQFTDVLTDNGPEFASRNNKITHPVERLLDEMGIKHRYTRPYRPQTNGKVERFWRTLNDDLIDGTTFETLDEFKEELQKYLYYYNELRPHQGINGETPAHFCKNLSTN